MITENFESSHLDRKLATAILIMNKSMSRKSKSLAGFIKLFPKLKMSKFALCKENKQWMFMYTIKFSKKLCTLFPYIISWHISSFSQHFIDLDGVNISYQLQNYEEEAKSINDKYTNQDSR